MWSLSDYLNQQLIEAMNEPFDKAAITGVPNRHYYPDDDSHLPLHTVYFSILGHFRRVTEVPNPPWSFSVQSENIAPGVDMPSQKRLIGSDNFHMKSTRDTMNTQSTTNDRKEHDAHSEAMG